MAQNIRDATDRMMTAASLVEDGIDLRFADGAQGLIPYSDLPEIGERATVTTLELPNPYEMVLETTKGETVEIPWDFARHYCDSLYRPTVEAIAMRGRHTLGRRIRRLRKTAGLSQDALARAAGIGRVTLVRLEKGEQTPRYRTLGAIAEGLGVDVSDLLVEPEFLNNQLTSARGPALHWLGAAIVSDTKQEDGDMNLPVRNQNVRFRRAFWENYAEVHPKTSKATKFLEGFGNANPQYWIEEAELFLKQWVGTATVGVYVQARHEDSLAAVQERINRYWPRFKEEFEDITYSEGRSWFVSGFKCQGGTRNFWTWDEAATWLEERREKYEEILSR